MIHTRRMDENGYLSADVNLRELATNTTQFSGAEIAGVVRLAASYALDKKVPYVVSLHKSVPLFEREKKNLMPRDCSFQQKTEKYKI